MAVKGAAGAPVGNLARPPVEMRLHRRPVLEAAAGERVLFHVADPAVVIALRPRPIRRTGPHTEAPMSGEGVQPRVQHKLPARRIVMQNQRPRVVAALRAARRQTPRTRSRSRQTTCPASRARTREHARLVVVRPAKRAKVAQGITTTGPPAGDVVRDHGPLAAAGQHASAAGLGPAWHAVSPAKPGSGSTRLSWRPCICR